MINQNRSVVTMLAAMILTVFIVASAHAARGGNGGSKPGGGDPACTDEFPSFVFIKEGKGNTRSDEIMLSSGEGCRVVSLVTEDSGVRGGPAFKFDNNAGLVAWLDPAREVWFLRFTLDGSGNITAESPQFALAPVSPAEFFSAVDVWADYSMDPPTEYISLRSYLDYREMEPPEPGVDFEIRIIDLSACSGSGCSTATLISKNSVESLACMDGPFYPEGQSDCLIPEGTPAFNEAGDNIYYTTRTVKSENEQWLGTARLFQPTEGWFANEPVANELVAISTKWDCVDGAIPAGGRAAYVDGIEVLVATACVGFDKGVRDQRLYFLDADECATDPTGWMDCIASGPTSGEIRSAHASWRLNGEVLEVLHDSWRPGSIRAIESNLTNDRQLISKGRFSDSGR